MAQAPTYTPQTNFAQDEINNAGGRSTVRTANLDAEFDAIEVTADALCANLLLLQRDDGKLRDGLVEPYNFSTTSKAYINGADWVPRGLWVTATAYAVGDLIDQAGSSYLCAVAHTSGTFNTDYAAGKWQILVSTPTAASMSFAPTGTLSSTNVQSAIQEVDAKAIAVRSDLASSASSAVGGGMVAYDAQRAYPRNTVGDALQRSIDLISIPGSDPTGAADSTAALNIAISMMAAQGGGAVDLTGGRWLLDSSDIALSEGVYLVGPWRGNVGERPGLDYTTTKGTIVLNPAYTIRLSNNSHGAGVFGLIILKKGLTPPASLAAAGAMVAAFAGTAITIGDGTGYKANAPYVGHCLILGFEWMIYLDFEEQPRFEYISGDGYNGIFMSKCYDMNHLSHIHIWPFLTTHQSWTLSGPAGYSRPGVAFRFQTDVDWGQADNCFSFGFNRGWYISDCNNVVLLNCGADHYGPGGDTTTIGFLFNGVCTDAKLIGCKGAAQGRAFVSDLSTGMTTGNTLTLVGCQAWGNIVDHVVSSGGRLVVKDSTMRGQVTGAGIDVTTGCLGVNASGNTFYDMTTPMFIPASVLDASNIGDNFFSNTSDATVGNRSSKVGQLGQYRLIKYSPDIAAYELIGTKSRGTPSSPTAVTSGDVAFLMEGKAYSGTQYGSVGYLLFQTEGTISSTATPGVAIIAATAAGAVSTTQRWVLADSAGNMFPLTDNAYSLGKSGARTSAVWSATAAIQTSDAREKTDIVDETLGLDFIASLRPVSYRWIEGGKRVIRQVYHNPDGSEVPEGEVPAEGSIPGRIITESIPGARTHHGFLAQEVKAALPQGVDFAGHVLADPSDPDSQQALRYTELIGPLVKAVQELSARLAVVEAQ